MTSRGAERTRRLTPAGVVRSVVATGEIVAITALAHTLAGGGLPSTGWLVATAAPVLLATLAVLHGSLRVRTAVGLLAACQVGLHLAFTLAGTHGAHGGHAAHAGHAGQAPVAEVAVDPAGTLPMLLAHLVAVAVTAALLALQEVAAARAAGWVTARLRSALPADGSLLRPLPALDLRATPARWALLLRSPRRGPPVAVPCVPPLS